MASLNLERYRRKRVELEQLEEQLEELRQRLAGRVTASYAVHVPRGGDGRGLENRAIRLADVETCYVDALAALTDLRLEVEEELKQIPDNVRDILARVYIDGWTVAKTAKDLNYNYRTVEKLKKQALQQLRERNDER